MTNSFHLSEQSKFLKINIFILFRRQCNSESISIALHSQTSTRTDAPTKAVALNTHACQRVNYSNEKQSSIL